MNNVKSEEKEQLEEKRAWPIKPEEWEREAQRYMEEGPYEYVVRGSGAEHTLQANKEAFQRWNIIPRMLQDVAVRNLQVTLLGQTYNAPFFLAPVGMQAIAHSDGELATARAAVKEGVPLIASTVSSYSLEQIADVMGDHPRWFQLYWSSDTDVTLSMVQRAERAGYSAIVLTVDTPLLARRESDVLQTYSPLKLGKGSANYIQDPVFRQKLGFAPEEDFAWALRGVLDLVFKPDLTWQNIDMLKKHTSLPILIKGILHPEDAKLAIEYGFDGIIVSNHGGRQLDGAIPSLSALPAISAVVQRRIPVLLDSGVRRGVDILKAVALGADAVLVGRPYIYGLAVGGEEGVRRVIQDMLTDLELSLALSGKSSMAQVDESLLQQVK